MVDIHFLCVGGTIDKVYFDAKSKYEVGSPAISGVLKEIHNNINPKISALMAKDSLEMDDNDREIISQAVLSSECNRIVITHGTDTMTDSAKVIAAALLQGHNKVVCLTGALDPAIFRRSDAEFNLGAAIATVQCAQPGVYIAMNGQVFNALNVRKDRGANRFIELS